MKKKLLRIFAGALLFAVGLLINSNGLWLKRGFYIAAFFITGVDVIYKAFRNIILDRTVDENLLMSTAAIGAFGVGEFPEAVSVMLFYQIGELFQSYAINKSRRSITALMSIRPDHANLKRGDIIESTDPEKVCVGDFILIRPGERVPLDGVVVEGCSMVDTAAVTGESVPRRVQPGSDLLSGCVNESGLLTVRVTKEYDQSTVSRILDLVENAGNKKSESENFISRFAAIYTPVVVIAAALLAAIPPLIMSGAEFSDWFYRALTFLVVSCPCALVISIPLSFFGGIGGASREGILVKGGNDLEALAKTETVVFDKTGTLTAGVFAVQEIHSENINEETLLYLAASAEQFSIHPIAESLRNACKRELGEITEVEEFAGRGVEAHIENQKILVGNRKLMDENSIVYPLLDKPGTVIYVAIDGQYLGYIVIADQLKNDAVTAVLALKKEHINKIVILTGDRKQSGEMVAKALGIDEVYTNLLPDEKMKVVEALLVKKSSKGKLIFAGDGLNDAPALMRADVGVAMGGIGSDAAIEAADVVIMTDEPSKIATAIRVAKRTLRIANQNIVFALAVKATVLLLGAFGVATMWEAVFADVGVSILAIINALRALKRKK